MTLHNMKFRIASPQQSEELQKVLFSLGYKWAEGGKRVQFTEMCGLYTDSEDNTVTYTSDLDYLFGDNGEFTLQDTTSFIAQHSKNAPTKKEEKQMKPHKHKGLIVAWANGEQIEVRHNNGSWSGCKDPAWLSGSLYRIKPERIFPKSSLTRQDLLKIVQDTPGHFMDSYVAMADAAVKQYILDTEAKQKGLE